ncbi:protein kinase domain-containing protein [Streptomyces niveiscabiei]|uniref:Protein kinase domain-containing protein n=2 Tax=Streptomyces niveiscabiei TaxID=164115 RepID=A0ABW9HZS2_9ACTN
MVGPFELLARLGAGGMGVAFLARRIPLDDLSGELAAAYNLVESDGAGTDPFRLVVVKMIRAELLEGELQARKRFGREIDAVRAVVSERVPALIAFQENPANGQPWFAMEYIAGPSLGTLVQEAGFLDIGPWAALGLALVDALRAIHDANLLHRDLKPGNVVMGPFGPVVVDFGLAGLIERASGQSLTETGKGIGTLQYMPLEQAMDTKRVTPAADVYSLGATLFYARTGRPPYKHVPMASAPKWDGVTLPYLSLLAQVLVGAAGQRPTLDALELSLLGMLAEADLTPALAAEQLMTFVESAGLTPTLPPGVRVAPVAPEIERQARQAIEADLPDVDPEFYGIDLDEADDVDVIDDIEPPAPAYPPTVVDPAPESPAPTSYPLPPPRQPEAEEPQAPVRQTPKPLPRAVRQVADDLRERYAHRRDL